MHKIYQKSFFLHKYAAKGCLSGFTLIELLVVMLIIGILAAISVSQYKLVVAKARIGAMIPLLRSMQQAQERYYMSNGYFANDIKDLDISCSMFGTGVHEDWCYLDAKGQATAHLDEGRYIIGQDGRVPSVALVYFYQSNRNGGRCYAYDGENQDFANRVCRSLSGLKDPSSRIANAALYDL